MAQVPGAAAAAAAVGAALAPYAWRGFTEAMLARRVLGAVDQYVVTGFVRTLPGADIGVFAPPEPADAADVRVAALMLALEGRGWRRFCLDRVCADLVSSLMAWQADRDLFRAGPGGPLEDS